MKKTVFLIFLLLSLPIALAGNNNQCLMSYFSRDGDTILDFLNIEYESDIGTYYIANNNYVRLRFLSDDAPRGVNFRATGTTTYFSPNLITATSTDANWNGDYFENPQLITILRFISNGYTIIDVTDTVTNELKFRTVFSTSSTRMICPIGSIQIA